MLNLITFGLSPPSWHQAPADLALHFLFLCSLFLMCDSFSDIRMQHLISQLFSMEAIEMPQAGNYVIAAQAIDGTFAILLIRYMYPQSTLPEHVLLKTLVLV